MLTFLTVLHILVCVFLILVVLLQAGKGGGMGIAFGGGGGSQTVFGSSGAGNFLTRLTSITATLFLLTSLVLAHMSSQQDSKRLQRIAEHQQVEKKSDEDRVTKLKQELEKARESAQKPAASTPAEGMSTTPPSQAPAAPAAAQATKPSDKKATGKTAARPEAKSAAAPAADGEKPAVPAKKKRVIVGPEGSTEKPASETTKSEKPKSEKTPEKSPESAPAAPTAP